MNQYDMENQARALYLYLSGNDYTFDSEEYRMYRRLLYEMNNESMERISNWIKSKLEKPNVDFVGH